MRKGKKHLPIDQWPEWFFPLAVFIYVVIIGLLVQLVILPYIFPQWQGLDGLIKGNDSLTFHKLALEKSQEIQAEGWQAWELAPQGQAVSGIASVFYVLIAPHPWVLLPLNALLHALATWVLFKTFLLILIKRIYALLSTLPFAFFPSSLLWAVQIHNDSYAVIGLILLLYSLVCFAHPDTWQHFKSILSGIFAMLVGGGFVWLVREYAIDLYMAIGGVLLLALVLLYLIRFIRTRWTWKRAVIAIFLSLLPFIVISGLSFLRINWGGIQSTSGNWIRTPGGYTHGEIEHTGRTGPATNVEPVVPDRKIWYDTPWLPDWIDNQMHNLAEKRAKAIAAWNDIEPRAKGSNIDTDVYFHSALDIAFYLPRATQIGFLSPFPVDWFSEGSKAPNTMMRWVSGFEMSFMYLAWFGLLYACWNWRKTFGLWVMIFFCTAMMLIYVLATPNVGSLYRFRYPFIMPLVGLGVAGMVHFLSRWLSRKKDPTVTPKRLP